MPQQIRRSRKVIFWSRILLCTGAALLPRFFNRGLLAAPTNAVLPAKIVRQYALTSANDFPQRDPMDWRLLGSNDGGNTWSNLDERKDVLFSKRHERQIFKIPNRTAFNMYRLEIERIREPAEANSIQLAGLEPLGETENDLDPSPIFADRITAQGENPNLEKVLNLFDGQADTKWLDFANQNPRTRASWIQWQYTDHTSLVISNIADLIELRSQAAKQYAVRLDGWIIGPLEASGQCCLMDDTGDIAIQAPPLRSGFLPGQRVRVEGISHAIGQRAEIADIRLAQQGPPGISVPAPMTIGEPWESKDEMRWGQVSGKIGFVGRSAEGLSFELVENGYSISVRVLHATPAENSFIPGMRVQVNGVCEGVFNSQGQRVVGIVWAATLKAVIPLESPAVQTPPLANATEAGAGEPGAMPLTSIREIRQLGADKLRQKPRVSLRGVVTDLYGTYIQDETGGIELVYLPEQSYLTPTVGDYVTVQGVADWVEGDVAVRLESVKSLGKGSLPIAQPSSWSELSSGHGVDQWVEIEGVVHSSDGSHVLLECEGEQALATIRSAPAALVDNLAGAVVRMRGVGTLARDEHQVRGITLIVPSLEFVEVEKQPADGFSLPTQKISSLLHGYGTKALRRRVKIEGVLTLQDGDHYFLQDGTGSAMAVAKQSIVLTRSGHWVFWQSTQGHQVSPDSPMKPGDLIEVVGFPELRGYSPVLTESLFHRKGHSTPVTPVPTDVNGIFAGNLDSTLVRLEGVLLSRQIFGQKTVMEFRDRQNVFEVFAQEPIMSIDPGSRVRVTGVCQTEPTPYEEFGSSVSSFKLLVGRKSDLSVLQRSPWWDFKHTMAIAGTLTCILVVAVCWIVLLRRQVEKRTMLLQREIEERKGIELKMERTHQQLLKTSRLAGMAEVATYVLHNVGNVLNSVNLLGSSIANDVHDSQVGAVRKLADLLASKGQDLGRFVTEDPRGQKIPNYLKRLGSRLTQEQSDLNRKVESLTENIQHIKEIVATQHAYAKISGVWEIAMLEDIVEDALRMQGEILVHHNIELTRDYVAAPPLLVDRHKVLQILFNLLQNAKHACDKSDAAEKQIVVSIRIRDDQHVSVCVRDNGIGIAPENLTRIFAQGFSTRKDGHGLGLHSSVLMAQDMGGTLKAFSAGSGKGAAFTLELPLTSKTDAAHAGSRQNPPADQLAAQRTISST
ncbi:MAG TPA: ATP-binding protein [Verrucomicrobiae bacterium]|nr:ATP-binding protein [Verrucomicrobiae bacterium]